MLLNVSFKISFGLFFNLIRLTFFNLVGYSALAINTIIHEDNLVTNTKEKTNKKNASKGEAKPDIPLPPALDFLDEDLKSIDVVTVLVLFL